MCNWFADVSRSPSSDGAQRVSPSDLRAWSTCPYHGCANFIALAEGPGACQVQTSVLDTPGSSWNSASLPWATLPSVWSSRTSFLEVSFYRSPCHSTYPSLDCQSSVVCRRWSISQEQFTSWHNHDWQPTGLQTSSKKLFISFILSWLSCSITFHFPSWLSNFYIL